MTFLGTGAFHFSGQGVHSSSIYAVSQVLYSVLHEIAFFTLQPEPVLAQSVKDR